MNRSFLFLDAHILLHYVFFTEIDWPKLANVDSVALVIPCTVISTLDKKKFDSADAAVRERAKKVVARFLNHEEDGSPIRENVTLCLLDHEPEIDFAQRGLSRESEDDRIIAEILLYRETHSGREIAVVTRDAGMTLKCRRYNIPVLEVPDEWRLPDRLDPQARQIRDLKARIAELESALPNLRLCFPDGKNVLAVKLAPANLSTEADIQKKVSDCRNSLEQPFRDRRLLNKPNPAAIISTDVLGPTEADWADYKSQIDEYVPSFETYLKEETAFQEYLSRCIKLPFYLANAGNAPAEDTDVYIHFDGDFEVVLEEGLRRKPLLPKAPARPQRRFGLANFINRLPDSVYLPELQNMNFQLSNVSGFTVRKTNSEEVSGHVERIKQGTEIKIVDVYIIFPSIPEAKSFTIDYTLNSASLPANVTGELHVKIEH